VVWVCCLKSTRSSQMSRPCVLNAATYCFPSLLCSPSHMHLHKKNRRVTCLNTCMQQDSAYLALVRVCCMVSESLQEPLDATTGNVLTNRETITFRQRRVFLWCSCVSNDFESCNKSKSLLSHC